MNPTQSPAETKPQVGETWRTNNSMWPLVEIQSLRHDGVFIAKRCGSEAVGGFSRRELLEPVSPAAAVSDRLFETGCALCGAAKFDETRSTDGDFTDSRGHLMLKDGYANDAHACRSCYVAHGSWKACDKEITRRRSLAEPGFKVGDEVEWTGALGTERGLIRDIRRDKEPPYHVDRTWSERGGTGECFLTRESLRLIRPAPTEAARTGEVWEPKVGEMVSATIIPDTTMADRGKPVTGKFRCHIGTNTSNVEVGGTARSVTRASLRPLPPATAGGERCGHDGAKIASGTAGSVDAAYREKAGALPRQAVESDGDGEALSGSTGQVVPERPKLDPSGFLDRAYLDEQREKAIPSRDAARLRSAMPSKHHQALAALNAASRKPRYAETSRVFSTAAWEEDS